MDKLVVCIMGQNCEKFIEMCLDSVKEADAILFCDGGSTDKTIDLIQDFDRKVYNRAPEIPTIFSIIRNKWNPEDKQMNGKQRNLYLTFLKENYKDSWCLCLDADEVVEDLSKIKEFIQKAEPGIYNVKMRHLIGDLGHEDASRPMHFVPGRLFKISEAKGYPLHSHPVLEGELKGGCLDTTIWHLGHLPVEYMDYILKRYKQHANDSVIHTPEFLNEWKNAHLFGIYPVKLVKPEELPKQILDRYELDKDEFYFKNRGIEHKHWLEVDQWNQFFDGDTAILFGCGRGPRVYVMNRMGWTAYGVELSKWAVQHGMSSIVQGDVLTYKGDKVHLVIAYDLLEHLEYKDLDKALDNLIHHSWNHILVSVPVLGDPNLELDLTHKIKEDKDWWIKKFTDKGCKLIPTPNYFLFKEQILIFEVPNAKEISV